MREVELSLLTADNVEVVPDLSFIKQKPYAMADLLFLSGSATLPKTTTVYIDLNTALGPSWVSLVTVS